MTTARFRLLVALTAILYLWWATLPRKWDRLPASMRELLERSGAGATLTAEHWATPWVYYSYYGILIAAFVGLLFLRSWGRTLLLVYTIYAVTLPLFAGVTASPPFDNFIGSAAATLLSVLLGVVYFSPISAEFSAAPKRAPEDVTLVPVFETGHSAQLEIIKSWLSAADIEYVVENEGTQDLLAAGRLGGHNFALGPSRILVAHEHAEEAKAIIADANEETVSDTPDPEDPLAN